MLGRRLPLSAERPHLGPMKPLSSAKTTFTTNAEGQLLLTIDHDTVCGVSPAMLAWWFEHIGENMEYGGKLYPRYLLWHPRDHIHWELHRPAPNGGARQGAYFRIVEAFAANPNYYVDSTEYVEKLDDHGISLVRRLPGTEVFRLEHRFAPASGGTRYFSRMCVGMDAGPAGRLFNKYVRPRFFPDEAARAWLTHNIEEVSMFENFLPELYRAAFPQPPADLGAIARQ